MHGFIFSWRNNGLGYGVRKHALARGVWRHAPSGKFLKFTAPETASGGF